MTPAVLETMLQKLYIMLVGNNVRGVFQTMFLARDQTIVFWTKRELNTVVIVTMCTDIANKCIELQIYFEGVLCCVLSTVSELQVYVRPSPSTNMKSVNLLFNIWLICAEDFWSYHDIEIRNARLSSAWKWYYNFYSAAIWKDFLIGHCM